MTRARTLTEKEMRAFVRAFVRGSGGIRPAARALRVSAALLSNAASGVTPIGDKLSQRLGYARRVVTTYHKAK